MPSRATKRKRTEEEVQAMVESFVSGLNEEERAIWERVQRKMEREREEQARKKSKVGRKPDEEKWNARLEVCKEWKQAKGRFPTCNKKDKEETSLYVWLQRCKPGGKCWTQARWEKLNEAFGEGWEMECFPNLETGTWRFRAGHPANQRDEAHWDATLEAVKLFKQTHGRFPRRYGGDAEERRLYDWLQKNMDTTSTYYTPERANKLVLAFGDRWQSECFPKSIYAW